MNFAPRSMPQMLYGVLCIYSRWIWFSREVDGLSKEPRSKVTLPDRGSNLAHSYSGSHLQLLVDFFHL